MCNCKKQFKDGTAEVVVPQTPDELLNQELKIWGGGVNLTIKLDEEIIQEEKKTDE